MEAKRKIIISSTVCAVAGFGFFALILFPQIQGIAKDSQAFISQRKEIAQNAAEDNARNDFQKFSNQHQQEFKKLQDLFVDPTNPISFLLFLEHSANEVNFQLTTVPENPKRTKEDPWPFIVFHVSSKGSFSKIRQFLQKIEYGPYVLEIKELTIAALQGSEDANFSVALKIYTQ